MQLGKGFSSVKRWRLRHHPSANKVLGSTSQGLSPEGCQYQVLIFYRNEIMVCISIHAIVWRVNECKQEDQSVETALRATKVRVAAIMPPRPLWGDVFRGKSQSQQQPCERLIEQLHRVM